MKHPHAAPTPDQPARFRQLVEAGALTEQIQVISAGQQQGSVDTSATDLLKQAEEVVRAAQEGKAEEVDKKLQDLQRKTDEQIDKGKIVVRPWARSARRSSSSASRCASGSRREPGRPPGTTIRTRHDARRDRGRGQNHSP